MFTPTFACILRAASMCRCAFILACIAAPASAAVTQTIDFNDLTHGQIVDDEYLAEGVIVSGNNLNRNFDLVVGFDTTINGSETTDDDLLDPFIDGNLAGQTLGTALILQENRRGAGDGIDVDDPDDEGRRPAGSIIFDFAEAITSIGFDLIDIESSEVAGSYFASFFSDFDGTSTEVARIGFEEFEPGGALANTINGDVEFTGDNSANRIDPITIADLRAFSTGSNVIDDFNRVEIRFGGSGAVDNLAFTSGTAPPPGVVPEFASFFLWAALSGAVVTSRRTQKRR